MTQVACPVCGIQLEDDMAIYRHFWHYHLPDSMYAKEGRAPYQWFGCKACPCGRFIGDYEEFSAHLKVQGGFDHILRAGLE